MRRVAVATLGWLIGSGWLLGCGSSDVATGSAAGAAGADTPGAGASGADTPGAGASGAGTAGARAAGGTTSIAGSSNAGAAGRGAPAGGGAAAGAGNSAGAAGMSSTAAMSKGWLYTTGNQILVANGDGTGTRWIGRGVNVDDLYLCGYNYKLETGNAEALLQTVMDGLLKDWKPNFVRMSLGMNSYPVVSSWLTDDATYKTPMTNVIKSLGAHPNTYVLVTLRSDASMVGQDPGNAEPTGVPSDATSSPDKAKFPTGTDAVYAALVDSFAHDNFVLFGLTNEPGGNTSTAETIRPAMAHAVSVIRAEEDRLGVPHHLVSVQGVGYSGNVGFYGQAPLDQDNVIYELHGYPPAAPAFTFDNIPVILGEYGNLAAGSEAAFFRDLETRQISSLAWDFEPYSNCAPDLLDITHDATLLAPNDWGKLVQAYLVQHAAP